MKYLPYGILLFYSAFAANAALANTKPTIEGTPTNKILPNESYHFQPTANDADGDALTFTIKEKPAWATFDEQTGALTGTPTTTDKGIYKSIRIGVSDGQKTAWTKGFKIEVVNTAPTITGTPSTELFAGEAYQFQPEASDIDDDALTYLIKKQPSWASFNEQTGLLSGTPTADHRKTYGGIRIGVSDGDKTTWLKSFRIKVKNNTPTISGSPETTVIIGQAYRFTPAASDSDGDVLRYTIKKKPAWASFDKTTGVLSGTPTKQQHVDRTFSGIIITAIDKKNARTALPAFDIRVVNESFYEPPAISGTPEQHINVGQAYTFNPIVSYTSDGSLTFSINNAPSWANFNSATGQLSGTPTINDLGDHADIVISVTDSNGQTSSLPAFNLTVNSTAATYNDAYRLLLQASFGATPDAIQNVMSQGIDAWVDEQLAEPSAYDNTNDPHLSHLQRTLQIAEAAEPTTDWYANGLFNQASASKSVDEYQMAAWWENALGHPSNPHGNDQLRQKVAYALSQLLVVANKESPLAERGEALAFYYDILARNALGNYRTLLDEITRSPAMGVYLSHQGNQKADVVAATTPDENFAREIIQLFSIGLYELNLDGSPNRDNNPSTYPDAGDNYVESYTQEDVVEMAKVMTGWDLVSNNRYGNSSKRQGDYTTYMEFTPNEHEDEVAESGDGQVTIMGNTFALNSGADGSGLDAALDVLFNHPNTAPFVSRHLIMRLVTSNPSSDYIARVASVFNDNGLGERGDLKAVVRAILLDDEARSTNTQQLANFGKVKEPLLALTQFLRAFEVQPLDGWQGRDGNTTVNGVYWYKAPEKDLGQAPLRARSVFNFYLPDFVPSASYFSQNRLVAPELQIQTDQILVEFSNQIYTFIHHYEKNKIEKINGKTLSEYAASKGYWADTLLISFDRELALYEMALDGDSSGDFANMELTDPITGQRYKEKAVDALIEHLNQLLLGGSMMDEYRAALRHYLLDAAGSQHSDDTREAWMNIKDAVRFIVTSSQYFVQK
ncbi:MAG: DUF1800 family protein [bacterium]